jgi:hypothetical protein
MVVHALLAIVLSSNFVVAIANDVPRYDVEPGCLGAAKQMEGRLGPDTSNLSVQERAARCVKTEEDARTKLIAIWSEVEGADRSACIGSTSSGGRPSYVELLVCLGIKREVRKIRSNPTATTPPVR